MSPYLFPMGKGKSVAVTLDTSSERVEFKIGTALTLLSRVNNL